MIPPNSLLCLFIAHLYATDFKLLGKGPQALSGVGVVVVLRSKDRHYEGLRDMGPHTAGLGEHLKFSHLQQNDLRINHKTI